MTMAKEYLWWQFPFLHDEHISRFQFLFFQSRHLKNKVSIDSPS